MPSAVVRIVSIAMRNAKFPQAISNRVFKSYDVDFWLAFWMTLPHLNTTNGGGYGLRYTYAC